MANVDYDPAHVRLAGPEKPITGVGLAGEMLMAGEFARKHTNGSYYKASNLDIPSSGYQTELVLALTHADAGDYFAWAGKGSRVNLGPALTHGAVYMLSNAPGYIAPSADIESTGFFTTFVGIGDANGDILLELITTGIINPT